VCLRFLGLCSCSTDTNAADPTGGPTTSIEQTTDPTVSPAPDPIDLIGAEFPAATDPDYVFSDTPQSDSEQYVKDTYPDLWAQGVRALSPRTMPGATSSSAPLPGVTVIYVDGQRIEGSDELPLGFRGDYSNPETYPTDTIAGLTQMFSTGDAPVGTVGRGGYAVSIIEPSGGGGPTKLIIQVDGGADGEAGGGSSREFDSWESAWAFVQANGVTPNSPSARPLYPGEVASITVRRVEPSTKNGVKVWSPSYWIWDSSSGSWVLAAEFPA